MRRSLWIIGALAVGAWIVCIGYPVLAGALASGGARSDVSTAAAGHVLFNSLAWSSAVALGAVILGWLPGRVLGQSLPRSGFIALSTLCIVPICLPAYLVFYAWWQSWPADSAVYRWAVEHEFIRTLRLMTLYVSLVCWCWPLVAWCVAGPAANTGAERSEMYELDAATRFVRWRDALRSDGRGLLLGGLVSFLVMFGNTTCFDLAEVFTFANELRAIIANGGTSADLLLASWPVAVIVGIGTILLWALLQSPPTRAPVRPRRLRPWSVLGMLAIWLATVAVPLALLARNLTGLAGIETFLSLYGQQIARSLMLAGGTGLLVAMVAIGQATMWVDERSSVRLLAHALAIGWIAAALVPAPVVATLMEAAWNAPLQGIWTSQNQDLGLGNVARQSDSTIARVIYESPAILFIAHLGRFGVIGALFGRWLAAQRPRDLAHLQRIDGPQTLSDTARAAGPRWIAAALGAAAVTVVLSLGEVPVSVRLQPPGFGTLAPSILNDMHYQRPRTVLLAGAMFVMVATVAALLISATWWICRRPRAAAPLLLVVLGVLGMTGCSSGDPFEPKAFDTEVIFGGTGISPGRFSYPRGIAVDVDRGAVYVVDKTARVQRFDFEGNQDGAWQMPEWELGKPTGLNVSPDGRVFVADTHYWRIIAYDGDGTELLRFGGYGEEQGEFIYPTDIAFGPDGRLYVSEYGGNDRIQVFSPKGEFLFSFGSLGEGPGQLNRPQSMVFDRAAGELYIADACNHRIVVVDPEGQTLRTIAGPGRAAGELMYPYDLALLDDGSLLVCEFGNNRVQRFDANGKSIEIIGSHGNGPGQLRFPWGVDVAGDTVFVLDSGNNRVQVMEL